jgi:fructose/tagatose bisphosphate aldolase
MTGAFRHTSGLHHNHSVPQILRVPKRRSYLRPRPLASCRRAIKASNPLLRSVIAPGGGKLDPSARREDQEEYLPAARLGVIKINIDTDGRLVWTRVHREFFRDHPEQFDFRRPGKTFVAEYANFIAHKNEKLGSAGQLAEVRQALTKKYS